MRSLFTNFDVNSPAKQQKRSVGIGSIEINFLADRTVFWGVKSVWLKPNASMYLTKARDYLVLKE